MTAWSERARRDVLRGELCNENWDASSAVAFLASATVLGCCWPGPSCIDAYFRSIAHPLDVTAPPATTQESSPAAAADVTWGDTGVKTDAPTGEFSDASAPKPLKIPSELPGADAPPLRLPPHSPDEPEAERRDAVRELYAPLPPVDDSTGTTADPAEGPFTLKTLQELALQNSPVLRQAAADVEAARGAMIQAGAYPNPIVGFEADTVRTANTNGYNGGFIEQSIVTAGKLRLAQVAAAVDLENARINLRKARVEVATAVRRAYFASIVELERLKLAQALARFTEQIYQTQIDLVEGGESAPYEPMQLRVLSLQARAAVVQSQRQYDSQRRQLAAALGLPDMPLAKLVGRPDMPAPVIDYQQALSVMLARHTDLQIASNTIGQNGTLLRLARVTPIPNIQTYVAVQHDDTFNPGTTTYNLAVGGELPVFNRNHGNILSARAQVYRAEQTVDQVRNDLTRDLADAYARYDSSRILVDSFREQAIRDQVQAYRGIYERYRSDPNGVEFNDVVVAQQTLAATLKQYIDVLGDLWLSVVDVAELMQVDDVLSLGDGLPLIPIPDLEEAAAEELPPPVAPPP